LKQIIRRVTFFTVFVLQIPLKALIGPIIDERFRKFKNLNQGTQQAILKSLYRNENSPNPYPSLLTDFVISLNSKRMEYCFIFSLVLAKQIEKS
jgi:hypothetical protein